MDHELGAAPSVAGTGHQVTNVAPATRVREKRAKLAARLAHLAVVFAQLVYWGLTLQLGTGLRRRRYARLIRGSHVFQPGFYLQQCRDDRLAQRDPIWHYLVRGAAAGLDPNPYFETSFYLERNPDVARYGKNPLVHYLRYGSAEGRPTSQRFDTAYYAHRYSDVIPSGRYPLAHFLERGLAEGRQAMPPDAPSMIPDLLDWAARHPDGSEAGAVLVVDHRMLTPSHDSGSVRMLAILRILLQANLEVTFVSDSEARQFQEEERRLTGLGATVVYGHAAAAQHLVASGHRYGTALLSRPEVARRYLPLVRAHAPWARVVYDTVDLHWVRYLRAAEVTKDPDARATSERYRDLELLDVACADVTVTITPDEREMVARAMPGAAIEVIPNIHECLAAPAGFEARRGLMFIGGYEHTPNVDAVEWFVAEVLPLIRRRLPEVVFHVVGSKAPDRIRRLASPSVKVVGYVPDPGPLFQSCRVFVSPLRYGAGMKGKIGHSMGQGLPVVTTTIGAEGMGLRHEEEALVADGAAAFAGEVVRLHEDAVLWSKISRAATRLLRERYTEAAVRDQVRRVLTPRVGPAAGAVQRAVGGTSS